MRRRGETSPAEKPATERSPSRELDYRRAYDKKWREKNCERVRKHARERMQRWRRLNPDKRRASEERYRKRHPDKYKLKRARLNSRYERTEKGRATKRRYYASPGGRLVAVAKQSRRRAAGKISRLELASLFEWFSGRCAYCGKRAKCFDHVIAVALGGKSVLGNLVPACLSCNKSKSAGDWKIWFRSRSFYSRGRELWIARRLS